MTGLEHSMACKIRHIRYELKTAQQRITELEKRRKHPKIDVKALRRIAAQRCHPDCGGSHELMRDLNALFDFLS